ncbi:MAG: CopG family transcriptional regulator [Desulfurococcales archaeon]|nr:CopG family transcriptional regulator [Desulfurococcales archaeon]
MGSVVLTIRIPRELREKMKRINVNWSEEIRRFIEERIKRYELIETFKEIRSRARKRRVKVDSTLLIREDRERR